MIEAIVLAIGPNESIMTERDEKHTVIRAGSVTLELPNGREPIIEFYGRRGTSIAYELEKQLTILTSDRRVHRAPGTRELMLSNAVAAYEISRAFHEAGHETIAQSYERIHQACIAYAYQLNPDRETN